jgi:hypothetical protein
MAVPDSLSLSLSLPAARCPRRFSLLASRFALLAARVTVRCPCLPLAAHWQLAPTALRLAAATCLTADCLRLRPGGFLLMSVLMSVLLLPAGVAGRGSDAGRGRLPPLAPAQCPVPSHAASCFAVSPIPMPIPMPIPSKPQPRSPAWSRLGEGEAELGALEARCESVGARSLRPPFSGECGATSE